MENPRVLSIQSHVVRGYVGNKSATFPLQVLGIEVDPINSVQFSNHTNYKHVKGQVLNENDLSILIGALKDNKLLNYSHLLTGYVGAPSFLNEIASVVKELRKTNPNLLYVCDPVMGDNGKMYVPETLLPIYRDVILPLADIITPNQYEMELLTGKPAQTKDEVWSAIDTFHKKGCKTVIVSSSTLGAENELIAFASTIIGKKQRVIINIPMLDAIFTGTGDLFSSLFLAWHYKTNGDIKMSLENTVASLQAVLKRTLGDALVSSGGEIPTVEQLELKLIQSKKDIEDPKPVIQAKIV